jgi:hypothetical protein
VDTLVELSEKRRKQTNKQTNPRRSNTRPKWLAFVRDGYCSLYKLSIATNVLPSSRTNNTMPKAIKLLKNLSCPANG